MEKAEKEDVLTIYEVSYLFLPFGASGDVLAKAEDLKKTISSLEGQMISFEEPVLIDLAYPMVKVTNSSRQKADSGYFGWVKFELSQNKIADLKKALDSNDLILRYLIIKTVRENTMLEGKMKLRKEEKNVPEEIKEEVKPAENVPVSIPEDIDKTIDDLVIV